MFGTPKHGNIGDHAITLAIYKFFQDMDKIIFEVSSFDRHYFLDYIKNNISKDDVIMINGGGFMGSQWIEEEKMIRDVVTSFPNNKVVIFPQTIYYKNDADGINQLEKSLKIYNEHKNLIVCTRELKSYEFACKNLINAENICMPDMVLYFDNIELKSNKRKDALLCMRNDSEKNVSDDLIPVLKEIFNRKKMEIHYTDTVINRSIKKNERKKIFNNKLLEFSNYEIIITDRLHGMIFAALTHTPCIALGNYNHKVKGVYEWIKNVKYVKFIENIEDYNLENEIEKLLSLNTCDHEKRLCEKKYFEKLMSLFRK